VLTQPKLTRPKSIPDLASRLAELGYFPVPIPKGSKGPTLAGWDKLRLTPADAPQYFTEGEMLVGCLHVNLACFDIDVYDPDLADEIIAEGFRRFPGALERIGAAPKSAIVLRLDAPGFKIHNTEKLARTTADGEVIEAQVEVRTLTRQMVVYGKHPNTGQPYRWPRGELWATPIADLPALTKDAAQAFRDWCNERIKQWAGIAEKSAQVFDLGDFRSAKDDRPSDAEFIEALHHVPASLGHENGWRETLMAIHDFFGGSARGLDVAKDWSSADPRYTPQEVETKWRSFEVGKGVGYRSVFHHARQHGLNLSDLARKHRPKAEAVRAQDPTATQFREMTEEEIEAVPPALFRPWIVKDLTAIKHPEFVYTDFYARGYTSLTVAPPKAGKSMLGLAEAVDMATGRGFLTGAERKPINVVYYNAEDDENVLDARIAALLTEYDIAQEEIAGRLFPTSGVDKPQFYMVSGQEGVINEALFVSIEKFIKETGADALIFDPLQDLSRSPETNEVFRLLGQRLRLMASSCNVALGIIHHTRKIAPGMQASIDDARGGSSLRGTARFNRVLSPMSEDEAAKAGLENHRFYFRIADMESNLAPPSADVNRWFEKVSVLTPNGHKVGAIRPWKWPDAFDGLTRQDAAMVRSEVSRMVDPPRADIRSANWVGVVIADTLRLDLGQPGDKARVKSILQKWIETDVLRLEEAHDSRNGRPVKVVVAGQNNPLSETEA
jgi:hypothetical protein